MVSMKDVNLSKRMEAVVNMVSPQSFTIADVGCDHAYVSIALMQRQLADKVIAMDVRTGPLDIAQRNVKEAGYSDVIDIRLGDGLERLEPGEVDAVIIAGMGGLLMKGILERGLHIICNDKKRPVLILQPQSDLKEVRMFLYRHEYHIVCETMLVEDGKYYTVMKAEPVVPDQNVGSNQVNMDESGIDWLSVDEEAYSEEEWVYGRCNLRNQNETLLAFLQKERKVLQQIMDKVETSIRKSIEAQEEIPEPTRQRMDSIKGEMAVNERALTYFG